MTLVADRTTPWTQQEAIDAAWAWCEDHGPCTRDDDVCFAACLYRSPDNTNCCFAGLLIPDSAAPLQYVGNCGIIILKEQYSGVYDVIDRLGDGFLSCLQTAHDAAAYSPDRTQEAFRECARANLRALARQYGLTTPEETTRSLLKPSLPLNQPGATSIAS